jgi:hypothetical protein
MDTSSSLDHRVHELEARLGRRIILRPTRGPDRNFRGRIALTPRAVLLEYRDETAGYFWDCDIIAELLDHLAAGGGPVTKYVTDSSSEGPSYDPT